MPGISAPLQILPDTRLLSLYERDEASGNAYLVVQFASRISALGDPVASQKPIIRMTRMVYFKKTRNLSSNSRQVSQK